MFVVCYFSCFIIHNKKAKSFFGKKIHLWASSCGIEIYWWQTFYSQTHELCLRTLLTLLTNHATSATHATQPTHEPHATQPTHAT